MPAQGPPRGNMRGTMMDFPLVLPVLLERAGKLFKNVEILSRGRKGLSIARRIATFHRRACQAGSRHDQTGTATRRPRCIADVESTGSPGGIFWNPCAGGIVHTLNPRLHPHEIAAIANHAEDRFLIVDDRFLPLARANPEGRALRTVIVVRYGPAGLPEGYLNYERAAQSGHRGVPRTQNWTKTKVRPCVSPLAQPEIRKVWFTRIARWCCTRLECA